MQHTIHMKGNDAYMIRIVADSSCDLYTADYPDFKAVPLTIYTDERSFVDDTKLNVREMLDYLAAYHGRSYTSCPSIDAWLQSFEGADEIIVFTITSALSGSYNSAISAAKMYTDANPTAKVSVIDSLSTGGEEILAINKTIELIKENKHFDFIDETIRNYLKTTRLFFSFFSVHNLVQNGRVNKIAAATMNVLNIAVTGTASVQGTIEVTGKVRGEKKSVTVLFEEMKKAGYKGGKAVITHVENDECAQSLKELVLKEYPAAAISIVEAKGLCSYYMERRGVVISLETE